MGWEHKLIVLLHTVILVSVPGSTFLPRAKWKLQIHVVMKKFQYEHSAKNYKVGKTQSCVTAGWEGSALIKASSSLEEPFGVYWDHSVSVCWIYVRSYLKADLLWHFFDRGMRQLAEGSTVIPRNLIFLQLEIWDINLFCPDSHHNKFICWKPGMARNCGHCRGLLENNDCSGRPNKDQTPFSLLQ